MICTKCRIEMQYHELFSAPEHLVPYDRFWHCPECDEMIDECDPKFKMPMPETSVAGWRGEVLVNSEDDSNDRTDSGRGTLHNIPVR